MQGSLTVNEIGIYESQEKYFYPSADIFPMSALSKKK